MADISGAPAPFTFVKQGVFYFSRRVPKALSHHYTSPKISYSLRTRSGVVAASRAMRAAQRLDEHWYHLRVMDTDLPGKHLLRLSPEVPPKAAAADVPTVSDDALKLSEAVAIYLRLKGKDRAETFHRAAQRACGYVIDVCGDKDLNAFTKKDANAFRDSLLKRGLAGSSITRIIGTVRSVLNFAASEVGMTLSNPFGGVYYDRTAGVEDRLPIPPDALRTVQAECVRLDDQMRWLVALVSDTGMRLGEGAGLLLEDLKVDGEAHPCVVIREHPWRRLKTSGSAREVPLVGASLWAARQLLAQGAGSLFAFPRYNKCNSTNANSASAALNKWMKPMVPKRCTMHSFRHSRLQRPYADGAAVDAAPGPCQNLRLSVVAGASHDRLRTSARPSARNRGAVARRGSPVLGSGGGDASQRRRRAG